MTYINRSIPLFAAAVALTLLCAHATGQEDLPSLDELLDLAPTEPSVSPDDPTDEGVSLDEQLKRKLTGLEAADTFEQAIAEMQDVSLRLGRAFDPGIETQRMQEEIIRKLDQVIEAARQQSMSSSSSGGSSGGSSSQRQQDKGSEQLTQQQQTQQQQQAAAKQQAGGQEANSGDASPGSVGEIDPRKNGIEELRSEWGNLPPRLRDELSEGLAEPFSPVYRLQTEAFYRRLSEISSDTR